MEIILTLTDRHVDSLCSAYGFESGDAKQRLNFAMGKISDFVHEIAKSQDVVLAEKAAREAKKEEIKDIPKPDVVEKEE